MCVVFAPHDPNFEVQLRDGRMTLLVRLERDTVPSGEDPVLVKHLSLLQATLETFDVEPEGQDFVAQKARGSRLKSG